ncbi:MAG: phosphoenolpyruvate carboxykinase [Chloroflexota bacterium]|nr:phosphoenolpyruvate carboxykinase [Chloroflexota bacterium]MDQ5864601.1 phosphoenolpyruvate carboxykinase [Chloroflexota bacterium]
MQVTDRPVAIDLGIEIDPARHNLNTAQLVEEAIRNNEGSLAAEGPLVVSTGQYTGRSPKDKFVVQEPSSQDNIWWGAVNQALPQEKFDAIRGRLTEYIRDKAMKLYVQDVYVGADPNYRLKVRIYTQFAWSNLFARNLFIRPTEAERVGFEPDFTVVDVPSFHANPAEEGTRTETFIALNLAQRLVLIGGTEYGGEIKKSMFTVMNYVLPVNGVLSMHCSANIGKNGDTALFFGLSGTGKTTLSADPNRTLIGDDEHGWSDTGVFNFEGGCYAKVIKLSQKAEPDIWAASHRFGTLLENVVMHPETRELNLESAEKTENTRSAYPIHFIPNASPTGTGAHPKNIMMLTADAFGVMPPIARLTPEQAMYYFLSGYTAKLAGTERGVTEPEPNFSACFGSPFLPLPPMTYARLLGEKIRQHGADVWLVNTGWSGGAYGKGKRMSIAHTRAMVSAALDGSLAQVPTVTDPVFGLQVPTSCPGVPSDVLTPRNTWQDKDAYDQAARNLAQRFKDNFNKFADQVTDEVRNAGPR